MVSGTISNNEGLTGKELIKFIKDNNLENELIYIQNGCVQYNLCTIEQSEYTGEIIVR